MKPPAFDDDHWQYVRELIRNGLPLILPEDAREWFAEVIDLLRRGEDPRDLAGTTKARNRPDGTLEGRDWWLAMFYFVLCRINGKGGELAANKAVAEAYGLTVGNAGSRQVRAIAKTHHELRDRVETFDDAALTNFAALLAEKSRT